jgi:hypothetical protein
VNAVMNPRILVPQSYLLILYLIGLFILNVHNKAHLKHETPKTYKILKLNQNNHNKKFLKELIHLLSIHN